MNEVNNNKFEGWFYSGFGFILSDDIFDNMKFREIWNLYEIVNLVS